MCRAGSVGKGRQGGRVVWVVRWRVDIDRERAVAREGGWLVGWLAHGARLERARGGWRRRPRRSGDGWRVWREGRAPPVVTRPVPRARVQLHLRSSVCVRVRESKCKKTVCASLRRTNEAGGGGRVTTIIIIITIIGPLARSMIINPLSLPSLADYRKLSREILGIGEAPLLPPPPPPPPFEGEHGCWTMFVPG